MNMYRGTLIVEPNGHMDTAATPPAQVRPEVAPRPSAEEQPATAEFQIRGMRSITTVTALQDLLQREQGVERIQVNAETERATIEYIPGLTTLDTLANAIERAGYDAELVTNREVMEDRGGESRKSEQADVTRRFLVAVILTVPLTIATIRRRIATTPWLAWTVPGRSTAVMSWPVAPSKMSSGWYWCWR